MAWNISCTILVNPSGTQENPFIKLKRAPINVTSNQEMQKSAKLSNTLTSFTHILMRTMQGISLTESQSTPQFTYSMALSLTGDPRKILKPPEEIQMQKQEQCTQ